MFIAILIIAFLIVMYILVFVKRNKKNKEMNKLSSVDNYRKTYLDRRKAMEKRRESLSHTNYVTKYNSTEDYREK
ncbi:hypothetical protein [Kineothrix sp. MB12-C1]|uniref:hypothetical protein n=1 Tax=Kineothrix sp. MB12-C1 TaxID=3070215 RepID=UPI0027D21276|nr:hypothetical protein [Kineothrix sp. MB12-C1]WMC92785.1 hypothetical protein RBB56_00415 [Kineothrix sp. MB12-C1]